MAIKLKITQVRSGVGRSKQQNLTLDGLGLRGPRKSVILAQFLPQHLDRHRPPARRQAEVHLPEAALAKARPQLGRAPSGTPFELRELANR